MDPLADLPPVICAHLECNRQSVLGQRLCAPCLVREALLLLDHPTDGCANCDPDSEDYL